MHIIKDYVVGMCVGICISICIWSEHRCGHVCEYASAYVCGHVAGYVSIPLSSSRWMYTYIYTSQYSISHHHIYYTVCSDQIQCILSHITQHLNMVSQFTQYSHIRKPGLHYFCDFAKVVQGAWRRISYSMMVSCVGFVCSVGRIPGCSVLTT